MTRRLSRALATRADGAPLAVSPEDALAILAPTIAEARENLEHVRAPNTIAAYAREWAGFVAWCAARGLESLPAKPEAVALFVAHLGVTRMPRGIDVARAAIGWHHRQVRHESPHRHPIVLDQIEALRRRKGTRPKKKRPMVAELVRQVVEAMPIDAEGLRDRAILLLGFAGAFRRSELVALNVADLTWVPEGASVLLARSKTDQVGAGRVKAIGLGANEVTCPVRALRAWLAHPVHAERAWEDGDHPERQPLFCALDRAAFARASDRLSARSIAHIVRARIEAAGVDPAGFAGHSLRAGLATSAARAGRSVWEIMATGGWTDPDTVAGYVRDEQAFATSAARGLL